LHNKTKYADALYSTLLFLATVFSRIPFRSQILYHWDSINLANGLRHFDVLQEHPQPPGYILYVLVCRGVAALVGDANGAMVTVSIVASALAVVVLYWLGKAICGRRVGLVAAVLLVASPPFWFYGEIALPHTVDAALVLLAVWLLYRVWRGEERSLWLTVVVLAVAGGMRQQTLVFLLPLTLYAVLGRVRWNRLLLAGALGGGLCLLWFIPLIASCGGLGPYMVKMSEYSRRFEASTSILLGAGLPGIFHNARKLVLYTAYGLCATAVPLGVYALSRVFDRKWPQLWRLLFLTLWLAPALLFYLFIHMGQQGLIFVFLPLLLLLGALSIERLSNSVPKRVWAVAMVLALLGTATFLFLPEYPLGRGEQALSSESGQRFLTWQTLVHSDQYYQDRFDAIRARWSPEQTIIVAINWNRPEYYLPQYPLLRMDSDESNNVISRHWSSQNDDAVTATDLGLSEEIVNVLLLDPALDELAQEVPGLARIPLAHGASIAYFPLGKGEVLRYQGGRLELGRENH
jgi:hypothetical protein